MPESWQMAEHSHSENESIAGAYAEGGYKNSPHPLSDIADFGYAPVMEKKKPCPGIERAIEIFGTQAALAKRIGVGQNAISYWLRYVKEIPPKRAVQIEAVTNGAVTRKELRPDLWG